MNPPVIDAHLHLLFPDRFSYYWWSDTLVLPRDRCGPDAASAAMAEHGVADAIVVQAHPSDEETAMLATLARQHPFIRGIVGWIDLADPRIEDRLSELVADPLVKAVRDQRREDACAEWPQDAAVLRGLRALARTRLAWDLLCRPRHLPAVAEAIGRVPGLRVVIEHLGKPAVGSGPEAHRRWAADLARLAALPGTTAKVSELLLPAAAPCSEAPDLRPWLETAVDNFGFDRLMWGSGWPVCLAASSYRLTLDLVLAALGPIEEHERTALLGGTARRVYALESTP